VKGCLVGPQEQDLLVKGCGYVKAQLRAPSAHAVHEVSDQAHFERFHGRGFPCVI
jgi:hypothetical protein